MFYDSVTFYSVPSVIAQFPVRKCSFPTKKSTILEFREWRRQRRRENLQIKFRQKRIKKVYQ